MDFPALSLVDLGQGIGLRPGETKCWYKNDSNNNRSFVMFGIFIIILTIIVVFCFIAASFTPNPSFAVMCFLGSICYLLGLVDIVAISLWLLNVGLTHIHFHITYS